MMVYEGVETKRFLPYWWSPLVALSDMEEDAYAFENGEHIRTTPFSRPVKRSWPEMGGREVTMIEHAHDEPVYVGFNREKFFKECKNAYFKYGGVGVQFAEAIYRAGLLSHEEKKIVFLCFLSLVEIMIGQPFGVLTVKGFAERSEERRVGKECRSRWSPYH